MKPAWRHILPTASPLLALLVAGCGGGTCGGAGGASDVCPPPIYGYAVVRGQVLRSEVRPVYAVADTMLHPFPPRDVDGGFETELREGQL